MVNKIIYSDKFRSDIKNILNYLKENLDNEEAATHFLNIFKEKVKNVNEFPYAYPLVKNKGNNNVRKLSINNYNVYYQINNKEIIFLTIRHKNQKRIIIKINR